MRALGRFRWLLPVLAIPACVVGAGLALQAAAFGRAPGDSLVAAEAVRGLGRYRVMRGTESFVGEPIATTCIEGWFRVPRRHLAHGALVLLGNGERLYDIGWGVRRFVGPARSRPAGLTDRIRFVLAACPNYLDDHLAADLVRGRPLEAVDERSDGQNAAAITAGSRHAKWTLEVTRVTHEPLALSFNQGRFRGSSDLAPGGGPSAVLRVRRAFDLTRNEGRTGA